MDYDVTLVRDPGSSSISEQIRNILLDHRHQHMAPVTELFLYESARTQLVFELIRPALDAGKIVISDRFIDSTIAYQGFGRSIPLTLIQNANQWACQETIPHRTYILDIPLAVSLQRRSQSPLEDDRIEKENELFFQNVREGYISIANQNPDRVCLLDGTKSITVLEQDILNDVLNTIETF